MFHKDLQNLIIIMVNPDCPTTISIKQAVTKCCDIIQNNSPNFPHIQKDKHRMNLLTVSDEMQ
jgi:hypothetical protein